ncbi:MAG: amino acid adenylation domain-containing protein, partial [bacterium]|nr:amino acid adenylation domain-containing protein [bacterium]
MSERPLESRKELAIQLAHLIATQSSDREQIQALQKQLGLGTPSPTPSTAKTPVETHREQEQGPVGIWVPQVKNGKTYYTRDLKYQAEFKDWAKVHQIPPKSSKTRIVYFGESVSRGYLLDPFYTPAQVLETLLNANPSRHGMEVVDLARNDCTLDRLSELCSAGVALEPDVMVIFAGNNWLSSRRLTHDLENEILEVMNDEKGSEERFARARRIFEGQLNRMAASFMKQVDDLSKTHRFRVVYVIPEFNLADFQMSGAQRINLWPRGETGKWLNLKEESERALENGDIESAEPLIREMIRLNESNPYGFQLLARCKLKQNKFTEAGDYLREALDTSIFRREHVPGCVSAVRRTILEEAAKYGALTVDLPAIFTPSQSGKPPGRDLFFDYCHMTVKGIRTAMAATAQTVISVVTGADIPADELEAMAPEPEDEVIGRAHFFAAVHNAHRGEQPYDILYYHCRKALELSVSGTVKDFMLNYIDMASRHTVWSLSKGCERLLKSGDMDQYPYIMQPDNHYTMDVELVNAMVAALKAPHTGIDMKETIDALRQKEFGFMNGAIDLLESYYHLESYTVSYRPNNSHYRAPGPRSRFFPVLGTGEKIILNLSYKTSHPRPAGDNENVYLEINGSIAKELNASPQWNNITLEVPGHLLKTGVNEIIIHWPAAIDYRDNRDNATDKELSTPQTELFYRMMYPIYGEIFSFTLELEESRETAAQLPAKPDRKNIADVLALTPVQAGMLFHYLSDAQSHYYFGQLCLDISGDPDAGLFEEAWGIVVQTNPMLRTAFRWEKIDQPAQVVFKTHKPHIEFIDLSHLEMQEKERQLEQIKDNDRGNPFNLRQVPFRITCLRLEQSRTLMIVSNHHILYDGWSNGIILEEFFNAYHHLSKGSRPQPPVKTPFKDYLKSLEQQDPVKAENFWRDHLNGFHQPVELCVKQQGEGNPQPVPSSALSFPFMAETRATFEAFARTHRFTLASLLYSAWGLLLQRYNNTGDVVFGTTVSGRATGLKGIENIVGLLINTPPLRVRHIKGENTITWLQRIDETLNARIPYETESLVKIKEYSPLEPEDSLFDTILVVENYPLSLGNRFKKPGDHLSVNSCSTVEMTHYDLTVGIDLFEQMELELIYNPLVLNPDTVQRLAIHYVHILESITVNTPQEVSAIEMLTEEERTRLLIEFNGMEAVYPPDKTVSQLFEEQAERKPDHIALVEPGTDAFLSYGELEQQANRLAHYLIEKGVRPNSIVGIMMERSIEMVTGLMGIFKAGAAYLPIDPGYPEARVDFMLRDSGAEVLIPNAKKYPSGSTSHLPSFPPSALAYILYTSGSTGTPKGVLVQHSSLVNRLYWLWDRFRLDGNDVILQKTNITFDVSVCESLRWIPCGGKLVLLPPKGEKDPEVITHVIETHNVTTADFIPSQLHAFLDYWAMKETRNLERLSRLRWVFTGAEVLSHLLVETFNNAFRDISNVRLINLYGPTEATVDVTHYDCSAGDANEALKTIPIGKPMTNTHIYIINSQDRLQPIGVPGELCIAGASLARGYLNRAELTAERFFDFSHGRTRTNTDKINTDYNGLVVKDLFYKTGDLARWLEDGNIEFLGRIDHQLKGRGFRMELGEIENQLLRQESIKETVVIAKEKGNKKNDKYLCAYVVFNRKTNGPESNELRDFLSLVLPGYMIPDYFIAIDRIPLTPGGKLDRKQLPEPVASSQTDSFIASGNEVEEALVQIWSGLLGIDKTKISVNDHFFELGGNSLSIIGLKGRIQKHLNVDLPLSQLFENPTVREIAGRIDKSSMEKTPGLKYRPIEPVEEKEYYPLVSTQKQFYVIQQLNPADTSYNMSEALLLEGRLSKENLETVIHRLIRRHESLRTSFHQVEGEPVQRVHPEVKFKLENKEYALKSKEDYERMMRDFIRPYDLSRAPLLRAGLIKAGENKHVLIFDTHHIIMDGVSVSIIMKEFSALWNGEKLPPLATRYNDYVHRTIQPEQPPAAEPTRETHRLPSGSKHRESLNLPLDNPRPPLQSF